FRLAIQPCYRRIRSPRLPRTRARRSVPWEERQSRRRRAWGHGDDDGGPPARRRWTQPRGASPGTSTIGDPAFAQPIHDRIHWASTEAAPAYAAHLEGAALVRLRAAEAIRTAAHPCADRTTA